MTYHAKNVPDQFKGSRAKYKAFTSDTGRTIPEIADHMNYTYSGTRASVLRMVKRGDLVASKPGKGLTRYKWAAK